MSMRKSSRSELRMLRTMMWHFGIITKCRFCKKPLLDRDAFAAMFADGEMHFAGRTAAPPIKIKMTIHHEDGNHNNNDDGNRKACHSRCHKQFHMKERHASKSHDN